MCLPCTHLCAPCVCPAWCMLSAVRCPCLHALAWCINQVDLSTHLRVPCQCAVCAHVCHVPTRVCHVPTCVCHVPTCVCHVPTRVCHLPSCVCRAPVPPVCHVFRRWSPWASLLRPTSWTRTARCWCRQSGSTSWRGRSTSWGWRRRRRGRRPAARSHRLRGQRGSRHPRHPSPQQFALLPPIQSRAEELSASQ